MKVAVLANDLLKDEMLEKCAGSGMEIIWANSIDELALKTNADAYFDLEFSNEKLRIDKLKKLLPKPIFINAVIDTSKKIDQPFIRINAWPGFLKRTIAEISAPNQEQEKNIKKIFDELKWGYRLVPDIAGMISARILAMIINEAYHTLHENVSTKEEVDTAMKLGTNYPLGPFEWSKKIGLKKIYGLLAELSETDNRYKVSVLMEKEIAANGIDIKY